LRGARPAELCSLHPVSGEYATASHQLSHAPSRQRRKLKWNAMVRCSLRWLDVEHPWRWWRALGSCRLRGARPAELCSLHPVSGEYATASHQLSHAPSRQRRKLKWNAMVRCSLRWLDVEHPWRWWRALGSCRWRGARPAELCSLRPVSGEYATASHQLSHAPSRQRRKLKWNAMVRCSLRWLDVEHPWRWWRALGSCRLRGARPAELCSLHPVSGEYATASHQLSHAPSRQRRKLKWNATMVRCSLRWLDV